MTIQDCAEIYRSLLRKEYILYLENGLELHLVFSKENFKHLLGLHKLQDMPQIINNSSERLYKQALKNINDIKSKVTVSNHYHEIIERITYFYLIPTILNSKIIVDFDPNRMPTNYKSKLQNTDYILYNRISNTKIAHLTIVKDGTYHKPETYFIENSNAYLSDQIFYDIVKVDVIDFDKR